MIGGVWLATMLLVGEAGGALPVGAGSDATPLDRGEVEVSAWGAFDKQRQLDGRLVLRAGSVHGQAGWLRVGALAGGAVVETGLSWDARRRTDRTNLRLEMGVSVGVDAVGSRFGGEAGVAVAHPLSSTWRSFVGARLHTVVGEGLAGTGGVGLSGRWELGGWHGLAELEGYGGMRASGLDVGARVGVGVRFGGPRPHDKRHLVRDVAVCSVAPVEAVELFVQGLGWTVVPTDNDHEVVVRDAAGERTLWLRSAGARDALRASDSVAVRGYTDPVVRVEELDRVTAWLTERGYPWTLSEVGLTVLVHVPCRLRLVQSRDR